MGISQLVTLRIKQISFCSVLKRECVCSSPTPRSMNVLSIHVLMWVIFDLQEMNLLFLTTDQKIWWECGSTQQNSAVPCLKIGPAWVILGDLGEPLGRSASFLLTNFGGSISRQVDQFAGIIAWRCGTRVHACSKCAAQVAALFIF
jgi:hypothetical protein